MTDAGPAAASPFEVILQVQEHDTAIDQLRHRRAHLPEREELAAIASRQAEVQAGLAGVRQVRDEVLGRQKQLEAGIGAADERIKEIEGRLYSGQVTATRDIMAMTAEVESLKGRRSALEDAMLGTMEEDEPLGIEIASLEAELAALEASADGVRAAIAAAETALDAEIAAVAELRSAAASTVAESLLATYERLRTSLGGVGAARLVGGSCGGCHLLLPVQEVARIKREPPDVLVLCDQCGRILAR